MGQPVEGALVAGLVSAEVSPEERPTVTATTNASGYFGIDDTVEPDLVSISTEAGNYFGSFTASETIKLETGTTREIGGRVRDQKGAPGRRMLVRLNRYAGKHGESYFAWTDSQGEFAALVPFDAYGVAVVGPSHLSEPITLQTDQVLDELVAIPLDDVQAPLSAEAKAWLHANAVERAQWREKDLERNLARATIVGLGEGTHGTREFSEWKVELVRDLVEHHGFRLFAIEASWAEALTVDQYVVDGKGDPSVALAGLGFWTVDTEEVLELIEWFRTFNSDRPFEEKVRFFGVDMQKSKVGAAQVIEFIASTHPGLLKSADELLAPIAKEGVRKLAKDRGSEAMRDLSTKVKALAQALRQSEARPTIAVNPDRLQLAVRNLEVLLQALEMSQLDSIPKKLSHRDKAMADNALWLTNTYRRKLVIWGHNAHVARSYSYSKVPMGAHLARALGHDYVAMSFAFGMGSFRARDYQTLDAIERKGVTPVTVGIAPPGFLERSLLSVQLDQYVIDLRALPKVGAAREWFSLPKRMREVGALFLDDSFFEARVQTKMFDLIAFVRTTTPAVPTASGIRGPGK